MVGVHKWVGRGGGVHKWVDRAGGVVGGQEVKRV